MNKDKDAAVRWDSIGFGTLTIKQKPGDFCYGIDAVLLADFAAKGGSRKKPLINKGKKIIDLGCGTGIVPLILSHKAEFAEIWGLELQEESAELAAGNVLQNQLDERLRIVRGDVADIGISLGVEWKESFDAVCSNPPYMAGKTGIPNESAAKYIARHETSGTLEDFIRGASYLIKPRGDFYMVHRPSRLVDILTLCRQHRLEPKGLRFVEPRAGETPNILLIHCSKNGNPELKVLEPLRVYDQHGYTEEIKIIYERKQKYVNTK